MNKEEISSWVKLNSVMQAAFGDFFTVDNHGIVDARTTDINLTKEVEHIPVQFGDVASFTCNNKLKSLKGVPDTTGKFRCNSMYVKDFSLLPRCVDADLIGSGITDLKDILPNLKRNLSTLQVSSCASLRSLEGVGELSIPYNVAKLTISCAYIEKGGIGLLLIPGLKELSFGSKIGGQRNWNGDITQLNNKPNAQDAFYIINEFVGRPEDIFECQTMLIDAGLEQFAIL